MEILFLGTGGGRVVTRLQVRWTGGILLKTKGHQIHIDPGPGALVRMKELGENPSKTDILILTHNHTDHVDDARVISECMKNGILVASEACVKGEEKIITKYYKQFFKRIELVKPGKTVDLGDLKLEATKTLHDDKGVGIKLFGERKIGFTSDTKYFKGLGKQFEGMDVLVLNVLSPEPRRWAHLCTEDAIKILREMRRKPGLVIITHFGMGMIRAGPINEARRISKESGVSCIAAKDGMRLDLSQTSLGSFGKL
ncbi:MAG: MBL fold metallo-hydrolase [Nanoarchaeota archaeon]|nr:MBL fold metallo-hydrolase [Nanoarchaeota archaeon]